MKIKSIVLALMVLLSFFSCKNPKKETRDNETIISVSSEDEAMNAIIDNARKTKDEFIKIIDDKTIDQNTAAIKYPFNTDSGSTNSIEHIWLTNITQENGSFYGIVANEPYYISKMKFGDKVKVDINQITDWKYIKNGILYGGKSIKYFYDQMSKSEQEDFISQVDFKFEED